MDQSTAPIISAIAAACSATAAIIAVWFSRQISTRERLDILKAEILSVVSSPPGKDAWKATMRLSVLNHGAVLSGDLAKVLKRKYRKGNWVRLMPAALAELRRDGYAILVD